MSIATIVRPFALGQVTPPTIVPNDGAVKVQPIVRLRAGRGTSLKIMNGSINWSQTFYTVKYPRDMTLAEILASPIGWHP